MKLVVGLGNPGPRYETTRHNVGFLAVDRLIDAWKAVSKPAKVNAEIFEANVHGEKVYLMKPLTYMNLSGQAVGPFTQFYQIDPKDMIIIQDEIDLPPLSLRMKTGGGSGGHNGLKSIDEHLGNGNNGYHRIRIGVGKDPTNVKGHVLDHFSKEECKELDVVFDQVVECCEMIFDGKMKEAMNKFHKRSKKEEEDGI